MKLIHCNVCKSIFSLKTYTIACQCGTSSGRYLEDGINAKVSGDCAVLGISNTSLNSALHFQESFPNGPGVGGWKFEAFIIPENAETVRRVGG